MILTRAELKMCVTVIVLGTISGVLTWAGGYLMPPKKS